MFTWPGAAYRERGRSPGGAIYLGYDPETQIEYGTDEESAQRVHTRICEAAKVYGHQELARMAGVAREQLRAISDF